jgi:hypothetical protein
MNTPNVSEEGHNYVFWVLNYVTLMNLGRLPEYGKSVKVRHILLNDVIYGAV